MPNTMYYHVITSTSVTSNINTLLDIGILLLPASLGAARRAFVLLDTFGPGWSYLHALPMEPPLTYITTNPELISIVISPTAPTKGFAVLIFIFSITFIK